MKLHTANLTDNLSKITGLAVVIDVLRAFTTSCFILNNGATCIYPVSDLDLALKLKEKNKDWVLVGERNGLKILGSDYGNSPTELEKVNLENKTVVLTTSAGTQAVDKLVSTDKIITGSFVNALAIARYIKRNNFAEVTFICTDNRWTDNEDYKLAEYISDLVLGKNPNFERVKQHIIQHKCSDGFLRNPFTETSKTDFDLAFDVDRFDFVIEAQHDKDHVYLIKAE
ncbi:MAG: hypothetical protein BroJett025_01660 [Patescibacteria group bacterium]|nr:MAG: hypothetical protein BroJett025_01660 [Patescibacteria group bacterium]